MRRVLITGGGTGIGRAIARSFAASGDHVTICGRRLGPLQETAQETAQGSQMQCRVADVTDEGAVRDLFDTGFDVVIANAGGGVAGKVRHVSLADWNATLAVNLTGTFLLFREALRNMGPGGRLIAIASTASLKGGASIPAYAAAKHGILGLVRSVALDVAGKGLTCNAVCPGFVDTDLAEAAISAVQKRFDLTREAALAEVISDNPMGRLIAPEEVVAAVQFLASAGASMVNGHALSVSGGEI